MLQNLATKLLLYSYIKVVKLKPDQPNQWLWACNMGPYLQNL